MYLSTVWYTEGDVGAAAWPRNYFGLGPDFD